MRQNPPFPTTPVDTECHRCRPGVETAAGAAVAAACPVLPAEQHRRLLRAEVMSELC